MLASVFGEPALIQARLHPSPQRKQGNADGLAVWDAGVTLASTATRRYGRLDRGGG
jgi:hypothetical protein